MDMRKKLLILFFACFTPSAMFAGSGDANNDGEVDVADIVEIVSEYILKTRSDLDNLWTSVIVDVKKIWADANVDGKIDMEDVKTIADYLMMSEAKRQNRGKALSEATAEDLGSVIALDGKVYPAGTIGITPIAMIVYVGLPGSADKNSDTYRGLAIALSDLEITDGSKHINNKSSGYESINKLFEIDARNGLEVPISYDVPVPPGNITSGWFMPSAGQYIAFYQSFGLTFDESIELDWRSFALFDGYNANGKPIYNGSKAGDLILGDLRKAGDTTVNINNYRFWTCSPEKTYLKTTRVILTYFLANSGFQITHIISKNDLRIRPFLAF